MAVLGHAKTYAAAIYQQGGTRLWTRVEGLSELSWGRKLDDYSEASVTVTKTSLSSVLQTRLGQVRTWLFELAVFRDGKLMWIGPIVQKSEFRDRFVFSARDVIAWFDRRHNPRNYLWVPNTSQNPGGWGEGDVGTIVKTLLADSFDRAGSMGRVAEHDPNLWAYISVPAVTGITASLQTAQVREKNIGTAVRDLLNHGLDMYAVGRNVTINKTTVTRANTPYRLTEDDFIGDLEIRENGLDAATRGIVTGGQPQTTDVSGNATTGQTLPPIGVYGGVDAQFGLIEKSGQSQTALTAAAVTSLAKQLVSYGNPPPVSVIVPQNTQLSPKAGIGINDLVPARRLLIRLNSFSSPVQSMFVLNEVGVSCTVNNEGMTEKVQVSFTTDGIPLGG